MVIFGIEIGPFRLLTKTTVPQSFFPRRSTLYFLFTPVVRATVSGFRDAEEKSGGGAGGGRDSKCPPSLLEVSRMEGTMKE